MKPILIHDSAEEELWKVVEYYENKLSGLGLDLETEVRQGLVRIQEVPERWPENKVGARKFLMGRFPYAIYYFNQSDFIWIVAIAHTRKKPFYWKDRF